MTLDELKNGNVIDTTSGKVENVISNNYPSQNDPHFSTNDGYRGRPANNNANFSERILTVDNLEDIPKEIKQVQSAPIDMNQLSSFDINSLPKKPAPPNELEDTLMNSLEQAVDREIESISERIDAVTEMQRKEMLDELANKEKANIASIPSDMENYRAADFEPETVVKYDAEDLTTPDKEINNIINTDKITDEDFHPSAESDASLTEEEFFREDAEYTPEDEGYESDSQGTFDLLDSIHDDIAKEYGDTLEVNDDEIDDEELVVEEVSDEEIVKNLQSEVKKSIGSLKKKFDLSKFKISDIPMAASKAVSFSVKDLNTADWVLPNANTNVTVTGLSGPELITMDPQNSSRNRVNTQKDIHSIIYRHIQDPNKQTFEHWMKTTRFSDIQHIYFALYKATFSGSNFIHYECPKCHNIFIQDLDFEDLVAYKDEDTKKKMKAALNGHSNPKPYSITRYQVSDNYVVDIKEPSLWNTVIEITSLSDAFVEKYEDVIDLMSFIHKMYIIDEEHMALIPIDTNPVKGDIARTTINKIAAYADVIRKISSDNFFALRSKIVSTFDSNEDITYRTPACNCRKCQTMIPEQKREGSELLFMRHQLGALGVM